MHRSALRATSLAALMALAATGLAACGGGEAGAAGDEIVIGVYAPLTGPRAPSGESLVQGVELAVERINADGGIDGKTLKVEKRDDTGVAATSTSVALDLASRTDAVAMVGTYGSDLGLPSSAALERQEIPNVQPFISAPEATERGFRWSFNTYPNSVGLEEQTFQAAITDGLIEPKRVAMIYVDGPFAVAAAEYTAAQAEAQGYEIVADEKIQAAQASYSSVLTKVKASDPDMIWSSLYPAETKTLLTEMDQIDLAPEMVYTEGNQFLDPTVADAVGDLTQGTLTSSTWWTGSPLEQNQEFVQAFEDEYGMAPALGAAGGYQSVQILAAAIESIDGDITREAIRDALADLPSTDTIMGPVTFDDVGQLDYESLFFLQTQGDDEVLFLPEDQASGDGSLIPYRG